MTLTTQEAAELLGVNPFTIRQWVRREYLKPVRMGANPLRFREEDVVECHYARQPKTRRDALDALAEAWFLTG